MFVIQANSEIPLEKYKHSAYKGSVLYSVLC